MIARRVALASRAAADALPSGGVSVADARDALTFWSTRLSTLPWHRRAARRDARIMVGRWRARLLCAQLERRRLGLLARALAPLLETLAGTTGARVRRLAVLWLWRTPPGRAVLAGAAALLLASLACLALVVALAGHLLPL